MNVAIVAKTVRDSWVTLTCVALATVGFVTLFFWAMQELGPQLMQFLSQVGFLRRMLELAYGINLSGDVSTNILYAIALTHPVVLALSWGFLLATCTRTTAAEFESGAADLLLTLPVSRANVLASSSVVWAAGACVTSFCPLLAIWMGTLLFDPREPVAVAKFIAPSVNFLALNLAVGSLATMIGCFANRRSHAIAVTMGLLLLWIAMNFLEPFLSFIEKIRFLNLLAYYRPADAVRSGDWPWEHIFTLVTIAVVAWIVGMAWYCRRDIPAP